MMKMNAICQWFLAHGDAIIEGVFIGVSTAATWALVVFVYGAFTDMRLNFALTRSLSLDAYSSIHRKPYIRVENHNDYPITILAVEVTKKGWDEKQYLPEEQHPQDDETPGPRTLIPGQWGKWVFDRTGDNLETCRIFIEYPSRLRERNFLVFKVRGKILETMRDQMLQKGDWMDEYKQ